MMVRSAFASLLILGFGHAQEKAAPLRLNSLDYFETRGLNVFVFTEWYNDLFSDSKMSGIEIIHHGVRTATNGDVRLHHTPEQWDPIPQFVERKVDQAKGVVEAFLKYPAYHFEYSIRVEAQDGGFNISVILDKPLPKELEGIAGLNLEFLPSAYFERTFMIDGVPGLFPLYPGGPTEVNKRGVTNPKPIATGRVLVLAPEDPERRILIQASGGELMMFDGRNKAQNGWYVVRSLLPKEKAGKVVEWTVTPNVLPNWTRPPVITYSQVGYHPRQEKVAILELDKNDKLLSLARLLRVEADGSMKVALEGKVAQWGPYLRYNYGVFDFSNVAQKGLYVIEYGNQRSQPFRIGENVYDSAWYPTLDVFFPVQMDHMMVNEAYRVWHGASHLDDALQAPVNHEHFDLYAQGPTTDSPYKPGEHIPGLNVGGWFDAGDFDIRTQSQYGTVLSLVLTWEMFHPLRDETTVDQKNRYVDLHHPDGTPDLLQQIEHGTLQLLAQHKAVGHAIAGIVESHLSQYTHLGDAVTKTDNLVYNAKLDSLQSDGRTSGMFDDRWAFTTRTTALNYGSAAALAAASRALTGYNDSLAKECLTTAKKVWDEEQGRTAALFRHGNTTGGPVEDEELKAAVELLITTKETKYSGRIKELWPIIEQRFLPNAVSAVRALRYMDSSFSTKLKPLVQGSLEQGRKLLVQNPFGVPISTGGWGGNGFVVGSAITNYFFCKAFPEIADPDLTFKGLHYIYGCHPGSNISFVSGVGTKSKMVAYGNNRADYSFIAGGVVPGNIILKPDFPENKEDWPFLWGENEYVIGLCANYVFLVHAVNDLLK